MFIQMEQTVSQSASLLSATSSVAFSFIDFLQFLVVSQHLGLDIQILILIHTSKY